ncbi:DNA-directed primase/polymerase protein [Ditylenchus destructor]|uniref:DNA-directed primase/polymerase protein n=1 Tax=Ditylenchus destructor TaxID=166010 RepID=A0AAD4RAC6_9BILA|nr:DNA-directed primase/polymerase protein [Ditylenchus destructor]
MNDVESSLQKHGFIIDYRQSNVIPKTKNKPNLRIFSFESPKLKPGGRKFIVGDMRTFYLWYRSCDEKFRHFYEIIQENRPCRLYFDLEYKKEFNVDLDGETVLDQFLHLCTKVISEVMGCQLDRDKSFLVLDSSTESKFSAHVIVHMPGEKLFPSNVDLKLLIKRICHQMIEENIGLIRDDGSAKFLCDLSVYSKNRNFRLFLSSKLGKGHVLKLAKSCRFYGDIANPSNAQVFLDALVVPLRFHKFEVMKMPEITFPETQMRSTQSSQIPASLSSRPMSETAAVYEINNGRAPSPFPELDDHMLAVFRKLNPDAGIRIWRIIVPKYRLERVIQYQLTNCRFCYNKKREHKRNNVYWSVHLDGQYYVQRCFDVIDCYKFSSEKSRIPQNITDQITERVDSIFKDALESATQKEVSYHLEKAFSESFYSSAYDRLFENIFLEENDENGDNS